MNYVAILSITLDYRVFLLVFIFSHFFSIFPSKFTCLCQVDFTQAPLLPYHSTALQLPTEWYFHPQMDIQALHNHHWDIYWVATLRVMLYSVQDSLRKAHSTLHFSGFLQFCLSLKAEVRRHLTLNSCTCAALVFSAPSYVPHFSLIPSLPTHRLFVMKLSFNKLSDSLNRCLKKDPKYSRLIKTKLLCYWWSWSRSKWTKVGTVALPSSILTSKRARFLPFLTSRKWAGGFIFSEIAYSFALLSLSWPVALHLVTQPYLVTEASKIIFLTLEPYA